MFPLPCSLFLFCRLLLFIFYLAVFCFCSWFFFLLLYYNVAIRSLVLFSYVLFLLSPRLLLLLLLPFSPFSSYFTLWSHLSYSPIFDCFRLYFTLVLSFPHLILLTFSLSFTFFFYFVLFPSYFFPPVTISLSLQRSICPLHFFFSLFYDPCGLFYTLWLLGFNSINFCLFFFLQFYIFLSFTYSLVSTSFS